MAVGDFTPLIPQEDDVVDWEDQPELIPPADPPSHHPIAPPDESFDISTAVDPSYIISLIRKLLPSTQTGSPCFTRTDGSCSNRTSISNSGEVKAGSQDAMKEEISMNESSMKMIIGNDDNGDAMFFEEDADKGLSHRMEGSRATAKEEKVWEECGCILWDLASSQSHAEIMIENLVLEVLLANLETSKSARVIEICLGMMGNLACHEGLMKSIVSTEGLIAAVMEQLFLDDTQCLCEAFRLLTLGLQSRECSAWAKALQPCHIMDRLVWIAENTLNAMLLEKSVGLLLAILESQREVASILLPSLIDQGLPKLLIDLLAYEMSKLDGDRIPERYPVLDVILRAIEALSVLDDHSHQISSNKELIEMICDLVKAPDKMEIAESCVTAAVLIAHVLADVPDLAPDMSQDLPLFRGLLDILPFTTNDVEARNALWTVLAQLLIHIKEREMGASCLLQYVSVLANRSDLIEDDLLDRSTGPPTQHQSASAPASSSALATALNRIISILKEWSGSNDDRERINAAEEYNANDRVVRRLIECCERYLEVTRA